MMLLVFCTVTLRSYIREGKKIAYTVKHQTISVCQLVSFPILTYLHALKVMPNKKARKRWILLFQTKVEDKSVLDIGKGNFS